MANRVKRMLAKRDAASKAEKAAKEAADEQKRKNMLLREQKRIQSQIDLDEKERLEKERKKKSDDEYQKQLNILSRGKIPLESKPVADAKSETPLAQVAAKPPSDAKPPGTPLAPADAKTVESKPVGAPGTPLAPADAKTVESKPVGAPGTPLAPADAKPVEATAPPVVEQAAPETKPVVEAKPEPIPPVEAKLKLAPSVAEPVIKAEPKTETINEVAEYVKQAHEDIEEAKLASVRATKLATDSTRSVVNESEKAVNEALELIRKLATKTGVKAKAHIDQVNEAENEKNINDLKQFIQSETESGKDKKTICKDLFNNKDPQKQELFNATLNKEALYDQLPENRKKTFKLMEKNKEFAPFLNKLMLLSIIS